ncbi:MAG: cytochrome c [Gemmatimonadaceae bacterium]|nr:cytochrome c [Gemmatimonadaceae bacterium]
MSKKRCFEVSVFPSVSLLGRAVLVGSVLSIATACARRDAGKSDSTLASTDSAVTTGSTTTTVTPSSPVESVSTGETTISAESKANPSVAATSVTSGAAKTPSAAPTPAPAAKPAAKPAAPVNHVVHHADTATKAATTTASAAPAAAMTAADTGQKATADTSKKTTTAAGGVDHLLVSPQEYEGWKMFSVYCYRCHGVDAMGGGIAPNLRHSVSSEGIVTHDVFITTVTDGRLDKGMPTWKALLSPEQMEDLWLYVNARSSNRLYPGRPHMANGVNP